MDNQLKILNFNIYSYLLKIIYTKWNLSFLYFFILNEIKLIVINNYNKLSFS